MDNLNLAEIVKRTHEAIQAFSLPMGDPLLIALSGGKDSLVLCLTLRELGLAFVPVIVDMGYEAHWAERVRAVAHTEGLQAEVVDVRAVASPAQGQTLTLIEKRLDLLAKSQGGTATPCTQCYSVKVLALREAARRHGARYVALGQHRTDAIVSMVKEALMHIDRWDRDNAPFERGRFASLVMELRQEFSRTAERPLLERIRELALARAVDTDEPPRQALLRGDDEIDILRPMFFVPESLIARTRDALGLRTEGSGCGHGATEATMTPRELVHYKVIAPFEEDAESFLGPLVDHGIDRSGRNTVQSRYRRDEFLGVDYKPPMGALDKA